MPDLERALRELAADAAWPPTPDLGAAVVARLGEPTPRRARPSRRRRPRRLVLALVAVLLALPAAALALPGPRDAILDALGLRHVTVERRERPPAGADPRLGRRTTLAGAARAAGFVPLTPARLGAPAAVYEREGIVTLVYDRPRVLLAQAGGQLEREVLRKVIAVDDTAREVRVGGVRGVYLGAAHLYGWTDATGPLVRSGPALIWERDGRVLRLEGARSRAEAVRIGGSVPPAG